MMTRTRVPGRATVLILTWIGGSIGHEGADYLIQRDIDAQHKQHRNGRGRRALVNHVLSYGLTQAAAKEAMYRAAGVRVPYGAQLVGGLAEMLLHTLIDDGRLLHAYASTAGNRRFYDLAEHGVNGRMLMDQAAHKFCQLPLGAVITALLAVRRQS
jgi:hypothetical protein